MKTFLRRTFALAALALAALALAASWNGAALAQDDFDETDWGGGNEQNSVLTINSDGSCLFTTATVESRTAAEQQVRVRERYQKMAEAANEDAEKPDLTATNETKPFTDDELAKKISEPMAERAENTDEKINVLVKTNAVLITTTRAFASLEEMLKESHTFWHVAGLAFENARFETDTNGLLRLTLTPQAGMERYFKTFRSQWKLSGTKSELKLIFPGKVVSSGFPAMETNATWVALDGKKDETLDAVAKLIAVPTVITAEPGGLKLEQPLEAKQLWRSGRLGGTANADLPITDAGPGFVAEAQSVTTTTLHVFPGGENYFKQNAVATGAVVNAKLFAPKGRTLQSVSDVRVLAAVDNKGRSVAAETGDDENGSSEVDSRGAADVNSLQVQLRLQLPQPDAQAIDKISAEAVAVTVGSWKEMTLTNLQENATNEIDLSAVLPGAKVLITKISTKNRQFNVQTSLQGPPTIKRLDVRLKVPGNDQSYSSSSERKFSAKNGMATRTLLVQGWGFREDDASEKAPAVLIIRFPEDLHRERVKFELKGLDLL